MQILHDIVLIAPLHYFLLCCVLKIITSGMLNITGEWE